MLWGLSEGSEAFQFLLCLFRRTVFGENMKNYAEKRCCSSMKPHTKRSVLCALFVVFVLFLTACGEPIPQDEVIVPCMIPDGVYVSKSGGAETIEVKGDRVYVSDLPVEAEMAKYYAPMITQLDFSNYRYLGYLMSEEETEELLKFYTEYFSTYDSNGEWELTDMNLGATEDNQLCFVATIRRDWEKPRDTSPNKVRINVFYDYGSATFTLGKFEFIPQELADPRED